MQRVESFASAGDLVDYSAKGNFRSLGKRFGKQTPLVANAIAAADALIVGGTSLVVYPAAGLTRYFTGDTLAICNLAPTDQDANADLLISCDIAAAFAF